MPLLLTTLNTLMTNDNATPDFNPEYFAPNSGGTISEATGAKLLQNNDLYRKLKSGTWDMTLTSANKNLSWRMGREDGKLFVQRTQHNVEIVRRKAKAYRKAAEQGMHAPLDALAAPSDEKGNPTWMWMDLPKVIAQRISDQYFGGMNWSVIKLDKTLKAQFYMVVEQEYNDFVTYPGGKLPLPFRPRYPSSKDSRSFFAGR